MSYKQILTNISEYLLCIITNSGSMVGRWGFLSWWPECGPRQIHPDDFEFFSSRLAYFCVVKCVGARGKYITIEDDQDTYRVTTERFIPLPDPPVKYNDLVRVNFKDTVVTASVTSICWHRRDEYYYFFLTIDGKERGKMFFESDFLESA